MTEKICRNCKYWITTGFSMPEDTQTCAYLSDEVNMRDWRGWGYNSYKLNLATLGLADDRENGAHRGDVSTKGSFCCGEFVLFDPNHKKEVKLRHETERKNIADVLVLMRNRARALRKHYKSLERGTVEHTVAGIEYRQAQGELDKLKHEVYSLEWY
jgi:hypothetical protein